MRNIILIITTAMALQACSLSDFIPATVLPPAITDEPIGTPIPSNTPIGTATPIPSATPQPILLNTPFVEVDFPSPTPFMLPGVVKATPFPTATVFFPGFGFDSVTLTHDKIYWGHCDKPGSTKMTIKVQDPINVEKVYLFFRLKAQKKDDITQWYGTITDNDGGGVFLYTLRANNMPEHRQYAVSWIQYQFVGEDKDDKIIARSQIYTKTLGFYPCSYNP